MRSFKIPQNVKLHCYMESFCFIVIFTRTDLFDLERTHRLFNFVHKTRKGLMYIALQVRQTLPSRRVYLLKKG